jgi:N-acyl-D-amino-acid deacylase
MPRAFGLLRVAAVVLIGGAGLGLAAQSGATAKRRIDATSLVVAPGFIDMLGQSEFNVLVDHRAASKILQGVTTERPGRALRGPGYKR